MKSEEAVVLPYKLHKKPIRLSMNMVHSLPTPTEVAGHAGVIVLYFVKFGLPPASPKIYPPTGIAIIDLDDEKIIEFRPLRPEELGRNVSPDESLGEYSLPKGTSAKNVQNRKTELYCHCDAIAEDFAHRKIDKNTVEAGKKYMEIFQEIGERPLEPYYRAFNPSFFHWLDQI